MSGPNNVIKFPYVKLDGKSGIYAIRHNESGKMYVGSAVNFKRRWRQHRVLLNSNRHHSPHLQNAWAKYGQSAFNFNVLEYVDEPAKLVAREQFWLDQAHNDNGKCYNAALVAGSSLGLKRSPEAIEKVRAHNIGRKLTQETKLAMSAAQKGRVHSPETIEKIRQANIGRRHSEESIAKMSIAQGMRGEVSAETRAKHSADTAGKAKSEAHKLAMKEGALAR